MKKFLVILAALSALLCSCNKDSDGSSVHLEISTSIYVNAVVHSADGSRTIYPEYFKSTGGAYRIYTDDVSCFGIKLLSVSDADYDEVMDNMAGTVTLIGDNSREELEISGKEYYFRVPKDVTSIFIKIRKARK